MPNIHLPRKMQTHNTTLASQNSTHCQTTASRSQLHAPLTSECATASVLHTHCLTLTFCPHACPAHESTPLSSLFALLLQGCTPTAEHTDLASARVPLVTAHAADHQGATVVEQLAITHCGVPESNLLQWGHTHTHTHTHTDEQLAIMHCGEPKSDVL